MRGILGMETGGSEKERKTADGRGKEEGDRGEIAVSGIG